MRKLKFEYSMALNFSSPVSFHYFSLGCVPGDSFRQTVRLTKCTIFPADYISRSYDGFGNVKISGGFMEPHSTFGYHIAGTAVVQGMFIQKSPLHPMYKYPSRYTQLEPEVIEFTKKVIEGCKKQKFTDSLECAVYAMKYLYDHFTYEPGVTDIRTTAAQALKIKKGVCQDYAHIMIAVMRCMGIPARYVNGFMIGEGYTHAWVEIYTEDGWYGLDPTNNLHIDDYYIKLAHGRDYMDCVIDKGIFLGKAFQEQKIYVNVEEA